jgi:hypothetical protein
VEFESGVLGLAELLPTELVFPDVPVVPAWLVLLRFVPLEFVLDELPLLVVLCCVEDEL